MDHARESGSKVPKEGSAGGTACRKSAETPRPAGGLRLTDPLAGKATAMTTANIRTLLSLSASLFHARDAATCVAAEPALG